MGLRPRDGLTLILDGERGRAIALFFVPMPNPPLIAPMIDDGEHVAKLWLRLDPVADRGNWSAAARESARLALVAARYQDWLAKRNAAAGAAPSGEVCVCPLGAARPSKQPNEGRERGS